MKNIFFYKTDIGRIGIAEENNQITNVFFQTDRVLNGDTSSKENTAPKQYSKPNEDIDLKKYTDLKEHNELKKQSDSKAYVGSNENVALKGYYLNETDILREASSQLCDYLLGKRQAFSLTLSPKGTTFMKKVWDNLCDIPYGKTKSYKEIAEAVGNAKACRAVGLANNRNPIPIFIPCHRVIGANGKLTGYRGGLETKLQLLELENQYGNI